MNKKKIINDPVYGFITIPYDIVRELLEHPWLQRLTRIRQLGLTYLVYPGALHTRFHHALGAVHLMMAAIETLRSKGHIITDEEAEAACIAILMHDVGHGPFSHALEKLLAHGVSHEELSTLFMMKLNDRFNGRLTAAIEIFNNRHPKKFLHQLVSSQLDVDRLDYLNRDSFFTGVSEGVISSERIIKMFDIYNGELVVEAKGIYSIEKFITARRLMYWQVYLHKTVLAAENMLILIVRRARDLVRKGTVLFGSPSLLLFLKNEYDYNSFRYQDNLLESFASLDDFDVFGSIKVWCGETDPVLSRLCRGLVERKLHKIEIRREPYTEQETGKLEKKAMEIFNLEAPEAGYFAFTGSIENNAYTTSSEKINVLYRDGTIVDLAEASDNLNISTLSTPVTKHFLCYAPELRPGRLITPA